MKTLMECRFMQTAMSDMPCSLTLEELQAEFNRFQTVLLDLLDGGNDYRKSIRAPRYTEYRGAIFIRQKK